MFFTHGQNRSRSFSTAGKIAGGPIRVRGLLSPREAACLAGGRTPRAGSGVGWQPGIHAPPKHTPRDGLSVHRGASFVGAAGGFAGRRLRLPAPTLPADPPQQVDQENDHADVHGPPPASRGHALRARGQPSPPFGRPRIGSAGRGSGILSLHLVLSAGPGPGLRAVLRPGRGGRQGGRATPGDGRGPGRPQDVPRQRTPAGEAAPGGNG